MTPAQRDAAMTLLTTVLSRDGYDKVTEIMHGDEVLRAGAAGGREAAGRARRSRRIVFGEDEVLTSHSWHAITDDAVDDAVRRPSPRDQRHDCGASTTMTPSLPAAQPATYT